MVKPIPFLLLCLSGIGLLAALFWPTVEIWIFGIQSGDTESPTPCPLGFATGGKYDDEDDDLPYDCDKMFNEGMRAESVSCYENQLQDAIRWVGPDHVETAYTHYRLALAYSFREDLKQSKIHHMKALKIREKLKVGVQPIAESLSALARLHQQMEDNLIAQTYWERVINIYENMKKTHEGWAILFDAYTKLAESEWVTKKNADLCLTHYDSALHILNVDKKMTNILNKHIEILIEKSNILQHQKEYKNALVLLKKAVSIVNKNNNDNNDNGHLQSHPKMPRVFMNLGNIHQLMGDMQLANDAYKQSLKFDRAGTLTYAISTYNLGLICSKSDSCLLQRAKDLITQAQNMFQKIGGNKYSYTKAATTELESIDLKLAEKKNME